RNNRYYPVEKGGPGDPSNDELATMLVQHRVWLESGGIAGERADLRNFALCGAALGEADLRNADLAGADLTGADLHAANLQGTRLADANLTHANLTDVSGLEVAQLTGTNLRGASLPERLMKFERLDFVAEVCRNAQKMFTIILATCLYCLITIATTND